MSHRSIRRVGMAALVGLVLAACGDATPAITPTARPSSQPDGEPTPIILDTDLDLSDAGALLALVLDPRVDVRAITITTAGTGVTSCGSARRVMGYLLDEIGHSEIPFACGGAEAGSDALQFPAEWRTPADTGWGLDMPPRPESGVPDTAVELLTRTVRTAGSPIAIVALGPWTNLAAAAAADPSFLGGVARVHAMAAALDAPGNVFVDGVTAEDRLEWNVVLDPAAFVEVFGSDVPITLVPLDATDDVPATDALKARLGASQAGGANLLYEMWLRVPGRIGEGQQLWDELAALAFMDPGLVAWDDLTLQADARGQLDRSDSGRPVRVATSANATATEGALVTSLEYGGGRRSPFSLSGTISVVWDGTTCRMTPADGLSAGVAELEFSNSSDEAAGVTIVGVGDSHTWADLLQFVRDFDPAIAEQPPDWLLVAGSAGDETSGQDPANGQAVLEAGTYGPVCLYGEWPDIGIAAGEPFEVTP